MDFIDTDILNIIEKYLPSKSKEKSQHGEVFTPPLMITNIYDHYPISVWSNPKYTWLDPANGIGNFTIILFFKLMKGLISIPNRVKRAKHIIENMIYMAEINSKNCSICLTIFKQICPSATPNIYTGDFLLINTKSLKWPSTFNFIIGNPPYNIGGIGLEGSKRTHIIFTQYALQLLAPKGYLAYICPPSYRETNTPMNTLFQNANGHFLYIKIYGASDTFQLFNIQGRVDSFIYQTSSKGTTIIDDEYNITSNYNIDLTRHIPNFGYTIFDKLFNAVTKFGHVDAFRTTEMSTVKHTLFSSISKTSHKILHLIIEKGRRVYKTKHIHTLQKTPKIFINGLGVPYVFYDKHGVYGPSQSPVIILNPSVKLSQFLLSDIFPFIAWGLRLTGNNNLPYLFDYVPDISKDSHSFSTFHNIANAFHLSTKEILFITQHFKAYSYTDTDIIQKYNYTRKKTH